MITKAAYNTDTLNEILIYTNSAREAWKHILNSIKSETGHLDILLPAYIGFTDREGSGIFDPVLTTEANYTFYRVNSQLDIDVSSLLPMLQSGKYNVLLIVHYFGFCKNDLQQLRQLCDLNNVIMVEDCAHAFQLGLPKQSLGITGDYSFYSVHKYLPVNTGGVLKVNRQHAPINLLPLAENAVMDRFVLETLFSARHSDIAHLRRSNFMTYRQLLANTKKIQIIFELDEHEVPQTFPVRIMDGLREKLYFWLMERQQPTTALYYRLIDEISREQFPLSYEISGDILNLPVHQDTTTDDIQLLCANIKYFLNN